ncbi:MAG: glycosyltransferase family 2 protein [Gallionellaceae bacterium]|jgi:glycosyltransferase involved in cell wall biosynthesis
MCVYVFIPTYNDGAYIRQSIDSLKNQTYSDFVCVINDDVSQDSTRQAVASAIIGDSRFVLICQEKNGGGLKNESTLIRLGKQQYRRKYMFYFSGHDVVSPTYLEDSVTFLETHPDYVMASSSMHSFVDNVENSVTMPEAEYAFFLTRGLNAFINSAAQLVNCTVINSVWRSDCFYEKDVFPIEEIMKGNDHLMISWMASYGYISISRNSTYFRRLFLSDRDHRPAAHVRLIGAGSEADKFSQDELYRALIRNYTRIFRARFSDQMKADEMQHFENYLFQILYRRFPYNVA